MRVSTILPPATLLSSRQPQQNLVGGAFDRRIRMNIKSIVRRIRACLLLIKSVCGVSQSRLLFHARHDTRRRKTTSRSRIIMYDLVTMIQAHIAAAEVYEMYNTTAHAALSYPLQGGKREPCGTALHQGFMIRSSSRGDEHF